MKRGDVVWLAKSETRCVPSGYCTRKTGCARYVVKDEPGRPVADFTLQALSYGAMWCAAYLDAAKHRQAPVEASTRVHEAPGGIFRG